MVRLAAGFRAEDNFPRLHPCHMVCGCVLAVSHGSAMAVAEAGKSDMLVLHGMMGHLHNILIDTSGVTAHHGTANAELTNAGADICITHSF